MDSGKSEILSLALRRCEREDKDAGIEGVEVEGNREEDG